MLNSECDQGIDVEAARTLLNNLPIGLDALFQDILSRSAKDIDDCITLFQWVLFSEEPMHAQQAYLALQYSKATVPLDDVKIPSDEHLRRYLLHRSRGLVNLRTDSVLQFIHETVRTFLLGIRGFRQVNPGLAINVEGFSHDKLKRACYHYIKHQYKLSFKFGKNGADEISRNRPFLRYATNFLFIHANTAQQYGVSQKEFLLSLASEKVFSSWRRFMYIFKGDVDYFDVTPLYIAVARGLNYLARGLVEIGVDINARGGHYESAFKAACASNNVEMMQFLLENGAETDWEGSGNSAFSVAFRLHYHPTRRAELVRLLQEHGRLPPTSELTKALEYSVSWNCIECATALLDAGADVNTTNCRGTPLLLTACQNQSSKMFHLMYARGARSCREDWCELVGATFLNSKKLVDLLLQNGAGTNDPVGPWGNGLVPAIIQSRLDVVDALLRAGADVHSRGANGETALHIAAKCGDAEVMQRLLKAGADVNEEVGGQTALDVAQEFCHDSVVRVLLAVNTESTPFRRGIVT